MYWDREYEDMMCCQLEKKMEKQRQEAIKTLKQIVSPDLAEDFACVLAAAYEFECEQAEKIAELLGLTQLDFAALNENIKGYEEALHEEYISELESAVM